MTLYVSRSAMAERSRLPESASGILPKQVGPLVEPTHFYPRTEPLMTLGQRTLYRVPGRPQ